MEHTTRRVSVRPNATTRSLRHNATALRRIVRPWTCLATVGLCLSASPAFTWEPVVSDASYTGGGAKLSGPAELVVHLSEIDGFSWLEELRALVAFNDIHDVVNEIADTSLEIASVRYSFDPFTFGAWFGDTSATIHVGFNDTVGAASARINSTAGSCTYDETHLQINAVQHKMLCKPSRGRAGLTRGMRAGCSTTCWRTTELIIAGSCQAVRLRRSALEIPCARKWPSAASSTASVTRSGPEPNSVLRGVPLSSSIKQVRLPTFQGAGVEGLKDVGVVYSRPPKPLGRSDRHRLAKARGSGSGASRRPVVSPVCGWRHRPRSFPPDRASSRLGTFRPMSFQRVP